MSVRVREGIRVVPTFAGYAGLDSFLTRRDITGKNEPLFQSGQRSAGSCCVSIRPRYICSQANRNSGQRAASGCSTRREPFQPIRPGLPAEPSGYVLRFAVADLAGTLTAKGIGVR